MTWRKRNGKKAGLKGKNNVRKNLSKLVKNTVCTKKQEKLLTFIKYLLYNKLSQGERGKYHASDISA